MNIRSMIFGICVALVLPMSAMAKPPDVVAEGCEILVTPSVSAGMPFTVTVVKMPSYPGQWFAPEVMVEIDVPVNADMLGPNSYSQSVTQTIDGLGGSNDATADFVIPAFPNLEFKTVDIVATVSEPVNKNRVKVMATCEGKTTL